MADTSRSAPRPAASTADSGPSFAVFLSHNSRDKAFVERIAERLKRAGLEPWLDVWNLVPGADWQQGLAAGLSASDSCAVFLGPEDLGAWSNQEVAVALDRAATDPDFRLFLVLLPGLPEQLDSGGLSPFLRMRTWVDYRGGLEDEQAFRSLVSAVQGLPLGPSVPIEPQADVSPYRGLEVFDEEHAEFFFGRDSDIQRLLELLKGTRFLAVLGASGSGKSSLVRAGLVPALRRNALPGTAEWEFALLRPGPRPLEALAAPLVRLAAGPGMQATLDALSTHAQTLHLAASLLLSERNPEARLLVVVDQFEEAFTLCHDDAERRALFANLLYASSVPDAPTTVVLTLRADFYHRCGAYPELAQQLAARQYLVSPLQPDGLRQAIEEPARRVGLALEPGLASTILQDVGSQPGSLPLLEHALLELWGRRVGGMLTLDGYRATGGVQGAIAQRADEVFASLAPEAQERARRAFLRLTQPGEGTEDTRRRAPVAELEGEEADVALDRLVQARLLTVSTDDALGGEVVEVAHEALIRGWPRLRAWIDENRAGLVVHRRLTDAASEWERLDRDPGALYRGAPLAAAVEWRWANEQALNELEREFLDASEAAERDALQRERRRTRRLRVLVIALAALLTLTTLALVAGFSQRRAAIEQRRAADAQRQVAESRALVTESVAALESSPDLATLLSIEAARRVADLPAIMRFEARNAMLTALERSSRLEAVLRSPALDVAVNQQGLLATGGADGVVRVWDLRTRKLIATPRDPGGFAQAVAFSPHGRLLAWESRGKVHFWDAALRKDTGRALRGHENPQSASALAFDPTGAAIAWAEENGTLRRWDVRSLQPRSKPLPGAPSGVWTVAISPDGKRLVAGDSGGKVHRWNMTTGAPLAPLGGHHGFVTAVAFSPDGQLLASADEAGTILFRGAADGSPVGEPVRVAGGVNDIAFSPDSRVLASAGTDGAVRIWDASTHEAVGDPLDAGTTAARALAYAPGGRTLVASYADDSVRLWNVASERPFGITLHGSGSASDLAFSPDGRRLAAVASRDIRFWDVKRRTWADRQLATQAARIAYAADGDTLYSLALDGSLQAWGVKQGEPPAHLRPYDRVVVAAALSSGGHTLASLGGPWSVRLWDLRRSPLMGLPVRHAGRPDTVALSPDGSTLVTAGSTVRFWGVERAEPLGPPHSTGGDRSFAAAFSPDGRTVATVGTGGVRLWDAVHERPLGGPLRGGRLARDVAFSADGTTLISSIGGGFIRLWDVATRQPLGQMLRGFDNGGGDSPSRVVVSPDGRTFASNGSNTGRAGSVRLWDGVLASGDFLRWRDRLCRIVRRSMSDFEWRQAMPDASYRRTCPQFGPPPKRVRIVGP